MRADFVEGLADLDRADAEDLIERLAADHIAQAGLFRHWRIDGQVPPRALPDGSPWRTWIIVGGRGFGKTRAGAEWVLARLREGTADTHIALVVSIEGQIAMITERINHISMHLKTNKKDFSSQRGLMIMVGQRKRLLTYLSKHHLTGYRALIEKLGLRK